MKLSFFIIFLCNIFDAFYCVPTSKMVIIADIHGDIYRFKNILQDANIIDKQNNWIATNTTVIQLGDQIDPKPIDINDISAKHHFAMIYFTDMLAQLATEKGSKFISLIGNHELMNIDKIRGKKQLRDIISRRPIMLNIDNYLFCHGGFKQEHYYMLQFYDRTIDDINNIWYKYVYDIPLAYTEKIMLNALILDTTNSILYTRTNDIGPFLPLMDIKYMFVGHTIYNSIHVKDNIWYLDLLLKDAFDKGIYNYIIIEDNDIYIKQQLNYTTLASISV